MGIRETLNENPRFTTGLTIGIIVLVLGLIAWQIWGGGPAGAGDGAPSTRKFFTDDDGKTWFPDDMKKIAPFQHNGKDAFEAAVYKCDGKTFVNHMLRYTPEGKKKMEAIVSGTGPSDAAGAENLQAETEVKIPGGKDWIKANDPKASEIRRPRCNKIDELEVVAP